jgi:hypothetical protein
VRHQFRGGNVSSQARTPVGLAAVLVVIKATQSQATFSLALLTLGIVVAWRLVDLVCTAFVILTLARSKGLTTSEYLALVRAVLRSR